MRDWRRPIAFLATLAVGTTLLYGLYWWYEVRLEVYPGDEVYEGKCYACAGRGSIEPPRPCEVCKGEGHGKIVKPGPNHPRRVTFIVFDESRPRTESQERRLKLGGSAKYILGGAVPEARLKLRSDRGQVETVTDDAGEARASLLPASWSVRVEAEGYAAVELGTPLEVSARSPKVHPMPYFIQLGR